MNNVLVDSTGDQLFRVPFSLYQANQVKKLSTSMEKLDRNYKNDFNYDINEYGFRYKEPTGNKILMTSGCSITFGQGIASEEIYASIVSKELGYECVNVALPGTGPDIQIMNATWALLKYKPEIILFYMSTPDRRFLANKNGFINWIPHLDFDCINKLEKKIFIALDEKYDLTRTIQIAWQFYGFVELCKQYNVKLYFQCWDGTSHGIIKNYDYMEYSVDLGNINKLDDARDELHPGPKTHKEFAERILNVVRV